eukprot:CAMPEP_0168499504 /NCGR_PEP_ID=MMETSP0228-20121227/73813_1 /TAXON_ID=133427 /ORGANISM="Protoceratium reticulatum, Strain CCCM 535 (=CCMP 1889)" /LENGTH=32 /DNA_ID= /DNA_START= /DNA_END= /DNA_ORIENTATION=
MTLGGTLRSPCARRKGSSHGDEASGDSHAPIR